MTFKEQLSDVEDFYRLISQKRILLRQINRWHLLMNKGAGMLLIDVDVNSSTDTSPGAAGMTRDKLYPPPFRTSNSLANIKNEKYAQEMSKLVLREMESELQKIDKELESFDSKGIKK